MPSLTKSAPQFRGFRVYVSVGIPALIVAAFTSGCMQQSENKIRETAAHHQKPPSSFRDTLMVNEEAAVFYNPDSLQLQKIKQENRPDYFESMQHESFFQQRNARIVLHQHWPAIRIIETSKARWIGFLKKDGSRVYVDLDTKNDMAGIFLFGTQKDPLLIDMMNVDTELSNYFKK